MMDIVDTILEIDHIGYAVKNMAEAKKKFEVFGYSFTDEIVDEARKVNVSVGKLGWVRIELLAPLDGIKSPVDGYLSKMGSTPYHICYKVSNMDESIKSLQEIGFTQIGYPAFSVPLSGEVCFLYSQEIGIVELIRY